MFDVRWFVTLLISALFFISGCGGGSGSGQANPNLKTINYIKHFPHDTQILSNNNPTFSFERSINDTSSTTLCNSTNPPLTDAVASKANKYAAVLKVIKIDSATNDAQIVLEEDIQVQNECKHEINFPSLILEENVGYAWRVSDPDAVEDENTKWNSFIYSTNAVNEENKDPHACENNLINDGTFTDPISQWQKLNLPLSSPSQAIISPNGHDDAGAGFFESPNEVLFQRLAQPMIQGEKYQLKFSLKHPGKFQFQVKVLAFNGQLTGIQPNSDTALMALTGTMPNQQNGWVKVTLPAWVAINNFENIAITVINDQNRAVGAEIDRVCLSEAEGNTCETSVSDATGLPDGFDINNSDPVVTRIKYLRGSVSDLYPNADTGVADWFLGEDSSSLECTTIDQGELTEEEETTLADLESDPVVIAAQQENNDWIENNNDVASYDPGDADLHVAPLSLARDCGSRILDYTKPFSGRDIVYVHGLQKDALDDLKRSLFNQKYIGDRWPNAPETFGTSGRYYTEAKGYWNDHINQNLGSTINPSNSYMIVTWSALQRANTGINAILHQIKTAREGSNDAVVFSANGDQEKQCFGDNGIVFVTHSTGGMLVSMMFGQMEQHKNDPGYYNYVEPALQELFDAQVGINAAYGRSGVATAGLRTTHSFLYPLEAIKSVLVDLGVPLMAQQNRDIMEESKKPTFMLIGSQTGPIHNMQNSLTGGSIFLKGYNDSVLTSWVQSAHKHVRPKYWYNPVLTHKLADKNAATSKSAGMIYRGISPLPLMRRYYVSPAFSPSGMLQGDVYVGYVNQRKYLKKHFPIIQTSGDHYDNVNKISRNGKDYYLPSYASVNNNEETSVVHTTSLYTNGYLSSSFRNKQAESVEGETWGLDLPRMTWVLKEIKVFGKVVGSLHLPKITWHYHEYYLWKRTYHLLDDYKTENGADYMYKYLLRP